ncbi:MAG: hypothetical protein ABI954_06215 [Pyrinomonadaceae bacterium]
MAVPKPDSMSQGAWDYLLKFTRNHEAPVLHMYNNKKMPTDKQDVTFGIGVQINSPQAALGYRKYFVDKGGNPASDAAITADWDVVSKILRKGLSVKEYEDATQCRVSESSVLELMASKLSGNLSKNLQIRPQLATFVSMPAQAKIALASYFYGHVLPPLMGAATDKWDFYEAGVQSHLDGMSGRKFKAHVTLFQNASQIVAQQLDYAQVPTKLDLPEIVPESVDKETAKARGLVASTSLKTARIILPLILNPLQIPALLPFDFGNKL